MWRDWAVWVFQDQRICVLANDAWFVFVITVFGVMGGFQTNKIIAFGFGPSATLEFIGARINTWGRWAMLVVFVMCNSLLEMWGNNVGAWIVNSVYVPEDRLLKYRRPTTLAIVDLNVMNDQVWRAINLYVAFTQIDILCVRIVMFGLITHLYAWLAVRSKLTPDEQHGGGSSAATAMTLLSDGDEDSERLTTNRQE